MKNNKIYLILQLQCLFNTPANFTFTGKFHTDQGSLLVKRRNDNHSSDNTQHLSPVYQISHLPRQTQPTHISDSQTGLWTYIPTFSHLPNSIDTNTDLCQTQPIYISVIPVTYKVQFYRSLDIPTGLWTYIPTLANQHSSQVTKLSRHTYQTKHIDGC